jgi:geranylgeranyl diphosphate synthase, type II
VSDLAEGGRLVESVLAEYGERVATALESALPDGILRELLADYPNRGGRRLRPALCIAVARAFGGRLEDALGPAVAIEMLHNGFLIHDDIEDGSEARRGKPALHVMHGIPIAINAGDALCHLALRPLVEAGRSLGAEVGLRLIEETLRMGHRTVEGQALELHWRDHNVLDVSESDFLQMILDKTCWYTAIYPCRVGALVALRRPLAHEAFVRFGFFLGAAFQIQDDVRNLTSDFSTYGKEIGGDLSEGKRTLQLVQLFASASADERRRIEDILARPRSERTSEEIRWLYAAMVEHESLAYAEACSHGLAGAALHEFELAFGALPDSRDKRFIEALCRNVLEQ